MDLQLEGKVVVVTGAARGLGFALATGFLNEGARVLSVDVSFPEEYGLKDVCAQSHKMLKADLAVESSVRSIPEVAYKHFGALDVLILNVGRHVAQSVENLTVEEFEKTFKTNVLGAALMISSSTMYISDGGAIITIGSTATKSVQQNEFSYRSSKYALTALTESASLELANRGIRVNIVTPGAIATDFASLNPVQRDRVICEIPMKREAAPIEIANVVLFLSSSVSSYITGTEIIVDGGLSMRPIQSGT